MFLNKNFGKLVYGGLNSVIMNQEETINLIDFIKPKSFDLLYRTTRDGFASSVFHSKCNGKENTVVIIKNNFNYVFGGCTSAKWGNDCSYGSEPNAYIFTLRRNGILDVNKFMVKDAQTTIFSRSSFGNYASGYHCDILINYNSNTCKGSQTDFGSSYNLPKGYKHKEDKTKCYLAGSYNGWLTEEIEVYQVYI